MSRAMSGSSCCCCNAVSSSDMGPNVSSMACKKGSPAFATPAGWPGEEAAFANRDTGCACCCVACRGEGGRSIFNISPCWIDVNGGDLRFFRTAVARVFVVLPPPPPPPARSIVMGLPSLPTLPGEELNKSSLNGPRGSVSYVMGPVGCCCCCCCGAGWGCPIKRLLGAGGRGCCCCSNAGGDVDADREAGAPMRSLLAPAMAKAGC
mmetsp:Transcript_2520/g.5239  ORF Transcript_2520/g.5239 Transcript_2520/m.5239 type:complete len:207 (-) Transcript_2520:1182-1802(-)